MPHPIEKEEVRVEEPEIEVIGDGDEIEEGPHCDIGDHLGRASDLLGQARKGPGKGLLQMIERMLNPAILGGMPFADLALGGDDLFDLDKLHGKIKVVIIGGPEGKEIEESEEDSDPFEKEEGPKGHVEIDDDESGLDDEDEGVLSGIAKDAREKVAEMRSVRKVEASMGSSQLRALKRAHEAALEAVEAAPMIAPELVGMVLRGVAAGTPASPEGRRIQAGLLEDLGCYVPAAGFFRAAAARVKHLYRLSCDGPGMKRSAYFNTRNEQPVEGTNNCPRMKTQKARGLEVPVEWGFCREQCTEGRPMGDGSVECRYAYWLENVADSHEAAMNRLDEQHNPANKQMELRLKDGERSHPEKAQMKGYEARLSESGKRGRSWDSVKAAETIASGVTGAMMNTEALIDEVLKSGDIQRDQSGNLVPMEKKLREASGTMKDDPNFNREEHLDSRRDKDHHEIEVMALDARLDDADTRNEFDHTALLDELIERAFPRKDSRLPE